MPPAEAESIGAQEQESVTVAALQLRSSITFGKWTGTVEGVSRVRSKILRPISDADAERC